MGEPGPALRAFEDVLGRAGEFDALLDQARDQVLRLLLRVPRPDRVRPGGTVHPSVGVDTEQMIESARALAAGLGRARAIADDLADRLVVAVGLARTGEPERARVSTRVRLLARPLALLRGRTAAVVVPASLVRPYAAQNEAPGAGWDDPLGPAVESLDQALLDVCAVLLTACGNDLSGQDLTDLDLRGSDLSGVRLAGADLGGVLWSDATVWPADLRAKIRAASDEVEPGVYRHRPTGSD